MNRRNLFCTLAGLLLCLACMPSYGDISWKPTGYWTGQLGYRGVDLEVRVHIQQEDGQLAGRLDIPALVFANQPLAITYNKAKSLSIEFPFGIGQINVSALGSEQLRGERGGFSLGLQRTEPPRYLQKDLEFGVFESKLEGTLYLPEGEGPHPVVVLIAGSGNATRENWSYASWVNFYLEHGVSAFVYDRRPDLDPLPDKSIAGIHDHAGDVMDAIRRIKLQPGIDAGRVGLAGSSRGAWIAMLVARQLPDLAFLLLSSPAAATPGQQEMTSVLTGMRQDGLDSASLAQARAYLRLYFYVAQTGTGWDLLSSAMTSGEGSKWLQYVDQPQSLDDLIWWRQNMNFDAVTHLENIKVPVMALWGGDDFITPWADYRLKLESCLEVAGNNDVTTRVFSDADHRLEVGFGESELGEWHWFGLAPGVLEDIGQFVRRTTQH